MLSKTFFVRREAWPLWTSGVATLGLALGIGPSTQHGSLFTDKHLVLHITFEVTAVLLAVMVWALTWSLRRVRPQSSTWLGICFFYAGLMGFAHALSVPGMPMWISPDSPDKAIYFWLVARSFTVAGLLAYAFFLNQEDKERSWFWVMSLGFWVALCAAWMVFYRVDDLPRMFVPGVGPTTTNIVIECGLFVLYMAAAVGVVGNKDRQAKPLRCQVACAAFISGLAEVTFVFSADSGDTLNLMGHLYTLIGLGMIGRVVFLEAVIQPELKLEEAGRNLQLALTGARAGAWVWNLATGQASADAQWKSLLGYSPDELKPQNIDTWVEMVHPEDMPAIKNKMAQYVKGQSDRYDVEYRVKTKSGEWRWVKDQGAVSVRNDLGRVEVMSGLMLDIHRRKLLEDGLRSERDLNRLYLDTVDAVIVRLDVEGRLLMINRKGLELFGYSEAEMVGMHWFVQCLEQPVGMNKIYPSYLAVIQGRLEPTVSIRVSVCTASGLTVPMVWRNSFLRDEAGRYTGAISAGIDLSDELCVQDQLTQQIRELRAWQDAMLDREDRIQELKDEVNVLLEAEGRPPRYGQVG